MNTGAVPANTGPIDIPLAPPALIVSVHDVMPETLDAVERCVRRLEAAGLAPLDLLIVPGRHWDEATGGRLRRLLARGHRPVGHGWNHRAVDADTRRRTLAHRLHSRFISRNVAEHLSRTPAEQLALMTRCHDWFEQEGLPPPTLYVPPAWALGGSGARLEALPASCGFRFVETLSGIHDREHGRFRRLPLLGFEADTPARARAVRLSNRVNLMLARRTGHARLAVHPNDFELALASDLERLLDAGHAPLRLDELFAAERTGEDGTEGPPGAERFALTHASAEHSPRRRRVIRTLEHLSGTRCLERRLTAFRAVRREPRAFWPDASRALGLSTRVHGRGESGVPARGALLVVANHPFGMIDGIAVAALVASRREDLKVITWDVFTSLPETEGHLLALDLADGRAARHQNLTVRRDALAHLAGGGALLLFPSGSVERSPFPLAPPREMPWHRFVAKLARAPGVTTLPVFVAGHNSVRFHAASHLGDTLRLSLLLRELARRTDSAVDIVVGESVPADSLAACNDGTIIARLRSSTLSLASALRAGEMEERVRPRAFRRLTKPRTEQPCTGDGSRR